MFKEVVAPLLYRITYIDTQKKKKRATHCKSTEMSNHLLGRPYIPSSADHIDYSISPLSTTTIIMASKPMTAGSGEEHFLVFPL